MGRTCSINRTRQTDTDRTTSTDSGEVELRVRNAPHLMALKTTLTAMERLFFGYADKDTNARECIQVAATKLESYKSIEESKTWEDLRVGGKIIINDIINAIKECTLGIFDITSLNENVLFELGVAIGAGKRVCILRDSDNIDSTREFQRFALLTTVGYTGYTNSDLLVSELTDFVANPPEPLLMELLGESDNPIIPARMLYIPSMKQDQAYGTLSRLLNGHTGLEIKTIDLDEYGTSPLEWLVQEIYSSSFGLFHFTPRNAYLADISNRRCAFLAGIAVGLDRPTRMAMRSDDPVALDYRDLRLAYTTSKILEDRAQNWIDGLKTSDKPATKPRKHLASELASLRFGNHVAESDQGGLDSYFVETRDYLDVVEGDVSIFTGRKGTGKTATMLHAAETLREDPRHLVVVIKPASYELEALCEMMRGIHVTHIGTYMLEGIWKYLLYTEVATRLVQEVGATPAGILAGSPVDQLRHHLDERHHGIDIDFSARLEKLIANLDLPLDQIANDQGVEAARKAIGKALYGDYIKDLRRFLLGALKGKKRVAILIDNLDKSWERGADLPIISAVIFGALAAVGKLSEEFARELSQDPKNLQFTLTAFLRSDIYNFVHDQAREPDKISVSEIEWRDKELLARVLEDRFVYSRNGKSAPQELWNNFFEATIDGISSKEYLLSRVQPRPRDLIFLANAAVVAATNARHELVMGIDVKKAEMAYSQFSYEALLVEGVAVGIDMESLLLCFVGEKPHLKEAEVSELIQLQDKIELPTADYIRILRQHGFLGLRVSPDTFDYGGNHGEMGRADVLASKLEKSSSCERMYEIHTAYRKHLEIRE